MLKQLLHRKAEARKVGCEVKGCMPGTRSACLLWGFFCQGPAPGAYPFSSSVSLFDLGARFLAPTHTDTEPLRGEAVKDGRVSAHRRLVLDGFEHGGTLAVVGMTKSRGSPRVVHEHSCHILLFGGSETRTMMQLMRIAAKAPRRRTHSQQRH